MKLLNLCCGAVRVQSEEWINVDNLHAALLPGTPERENLDAEKNYVNCDVLSEPGIPAEWAETFDGIMCSHAIEHFDCQQAVYVMKQCRCLLKPGGVLLVSVPDASYFRKVHDEDTAENAERLFGEPIHLPDGETTFFGYGLFNRWHKAVLTEDALWCYFVRAGFAPCYTYRPQHPETGKANANGGDPFYEMMAQLNRLQFSLIMCGVKEHQ